MALLEIRQFKVLESAGLLWALDVMVMQRNSIKHFRGKKIPNNN